MAMRTWVIRRARRSSCNVISSPMSLVARAATFLRRAGLSSFPDPFEVCHIVRSCEANRDPLEAHARIAI